MGGGLIVGRVTLSAFTVGGAVGGVALVTPAWPFGLALIIGLLSIGILVGYEIDELLSDLEADGYFEGSVDE